MSTWDFVDRLNILRKIYRRIYDSTAALTFACDVLPGREVVTVDL
jgi:hypothetical protein